MSRPTKRQPNVFCIDKDNRFLVQVDAVMSRLVAVVDGVRVVIFQDAPDRWYMPVDDAIPWVAEEIKSGVKTHMTVPYAKILDKLIQAREQFQNGTIIDQGDPEGR